MYSRRAEEPANFLAAPAPDFFSKRLRLVVFFKWPWLHGAKNTRLRLTSPGKYHETQESFLLQRKKKNAGPNLTVKVLKQMHLDMKHRSFTDVSAE